MNARSWFFSGIAVCLNIPVFVYAQQGLVPCGRTGQDDCQTCHVVQLVSGVNAWLVGILAIVATIMFVIAGFRLVTSNGNPGVLQDAKSMIINVAIGFVIVLAAWLLLDLFMKSLLSDTQQGLGPWNEIACVPQPESRTDPDQLDIYIIREQNSSTCTTAASCEVLVQQCQDRPDGTETITGSPGNFQVTCAFTSTSESGGGGGRVTPGGRGEAQCAADNTNCSVELLQSLGLTETQANIMSCVAVTENSGGSVGCSGTGPCGTFQITQTNWGIYTNGSSSDHPDCSAANFGGSISAAQNNGPCNARVMTSMVRDSGYQPWTGANTNPNDSVPDGPWNPYARGCVNTHGNAGDTTRRGF
jgi:hypothetical protein